MPILSQKKVPKIQRHKSDFCEENSSPLQLCTASHIQCIFSSTGRYLTFAVSTLDCPHSARTLTIHVGPSVHPARLFPGSGGTIVEASAALMSTGKPGADGDSRFTWLEGSRLEYKLDLKKLDWYKLNVVAVVCSCACALALVESPCVVLWIAVGGNTCFNEIKINVHLTLHQGKRGVSITFLYLALH